MGVFPLSGAYAYSMQPGWTCEFFKSYGYHWFLPFMSLFLVGFGGWAIGMRNMIIYELESDYSHYLEALGAPTRLVRRYAYRNAVLPQITGLALALGAVVAGALVTEVVFTYPGPRLDDPQRDPEPRLLPAPGDLPLHHRRRPDRELPRRHRVRDRRPADADRDAGRPGVTPHAPSSRSDGRPAPRKRRPKRSEFLYFALRNTKLLIGLASCCS